MMEDGRYQLLLAKIYSKMEKTDETIASLQQVKGENPMKACNILIFISCFTFNLVSNHIFVDEKNGYMVVINHQWLVWNRAKLVSVWFLWAVSSESWIRLLGTTGYLHSYYVFICVWNIDGLFSYTLLKLWGQISYLPVAQHWMPFMEQPRITYNGYMSLSCKERNRKP